MNNGVSTILVINCIRRSLFSELGSLALGENNKQTRISKSEVTVDCLFSDLAVQPKVAKHLSKFLEDLLSFVAI